MNPTDFFVRQQLQNLDSQCGTALARIRIARSMRDVKLACNVHAHSVVKPLSDAKTLLRRVDQAAEQKLLQFLEVQMTELRSCTTIEEFKAARGRLIRDHWEYLRGTFATIYRRAARDSMSIQGALERGAPSAQQLPNARQAFVERGEDGGLFVKCIEADGRVLPPVYVDDQAQAETQRINWVRGTGPNDKPLHSQEADLDAAATAGYQAGKRGTTKPPYELSSQEQADAWRIGNRRWRDELARPQQPESDDDPAEDAPGMR